MSQPSESDQQQAVRSAQERTLGQYHQFMQINAASHLIRALRQLGLIDALREQQHTLQQLCTPGSLNAELVREILDAAVAIGIVEQYEDDYALSRAAHLLCQYDHDLADQRWERLVSLTRGESKRDAHDDRLHANHLAATQWIHTPAAMEAAEVLDFGGGTFDSSVIETTKTGALSNSGLQLGSASASPCMLGSAPPTRIAPTTPKQTIYLCA